MSCAYDKERLTAFFDGELDAAERAATERHVSECSECLRDLGEIKSAALAVKTLERPRAPRSIAEGVAREIAASGKVKRLDLWRRRVLWAVSAAAIVLVTLNVMFFMKPPPSAEQARNGSAAPGIAMAKDVDGLSENRKNLQHEGTYKEAAKEPSADAAARRLRESAGKLEAGKKSEADRVPAPGEDLNRLRQADGKPAAPERALAKADEKAPARPEAAAPAAPPAPAAPMPATKPAPRPEPKPEAKAEPRAALAEESRRKEAEQQDKAADLKKQTAAADPAARPGAGAAQGSLPEVAAYTVRGEKAALQARVQAESLKKRWAAGEGAAKAAPSVASGAPRTSGGRDFGGGGAAAPLVLEVTPEQFEELRAELAKAGLTIEAGVPAESLRGGGKDAVTGGLAEAPKERAELETRGAETEKKLKGAAPATRRITLHFVESAPKK
jgi:hypothetical protein